MTAVDEALARSQGHLDTGLLANDQNPNPFVFVLMRAIARSHITYKVDPSSGLLACTPRNQSKGLTKDALRGVAMAKCRQGS